MSEPYSQQVIDHFVAPRNLGRLPDANGRGVSGDLRTGDVRIEIAIRVESDRVAAARFRTFGCSVAIAASSVATTLIAERPVREAAALTAAQITGALGGLPSRPPLCPGDGRRGGPPRPRRLGTSGRELR